MAEELYRAPLTPEEIDHLRQWLSAPPSAGNQLGDLIKGAAYTPRLLATLDAEKKAHADTSARAERWEKAADRRQSHIYQLKTEVESLCRHVCASTCPECAAIREAKKGGQS